MRAKVPGRILLPLKFTLAALATVVLVTTFSTVFLARRTVSGPVAPDGTVTLWANDGDDKVTQDEQRMTTGQNVINSVWDGTTINVFGARNEVVNFNVVLEAPSAASNVSVIFNTLTHPNGNTIASVPASGDQVFSFLNRNIELFLIRYLPIRGLSKMSYTSYYDERHAPQRMRRPWTGDGSATGTWQDRPDHDKYYPEIAVPLELAPTFSIAAGHNQSIWVDIYIPKGAAAGQYQGSLVVQQNGALVQTVPVLLNVYNFALPDTPSAKTMVEFDSANVNRRYLANLADSNGYINPSSPAAAQARLLRDRHFLLAHRHRISLIGDAIGNDCSPVVDQPCPEWLPRLNGSLFTASNGYDGPGVNTGNNVYSVGTYGSWSWQSGGQSAMNQHSDAWVTWFDQNALSPVTDFFLYLLDEPSTATQISQVQQWASWILSNPGPGHRLLSLATVPLPTVASNTPALDIPTSNLEVGIPSQWQPLADQYTSDSRKRFYMYNGRRPASGSFATEDDGVALRELAWGQFKKRINRWYFWEGTYYNNYQGGMGDTNVFQNAQTFGGYSQTDPVVGQTGWNYSNGDGVLFYPGTDLLFPADSYGVNGPFASLRLKYWRRGVQDVDYLTMAAAINPGAVTSLVNAMVPKVLWENGVDNVSDPSYVHTDISWSINPDTWEIARKLLANIISGTPPFQQFAVRFYYPTTNTMRLYFDAAANGNPGVAGYRIDLATDGGFTMVIPGYANKDVGNVPYVILDGLQPGATYYARARAYDASGNVSGNTPIVTMATLNADYAAQSSPVTVSLSNPTQSSLSLSWVPSTSTASITASNYQVQVSTLATFSDFANQPWSGLFYQSSATNAVLTGLGPGTLYYVRVRATDTYGNSSNYVAVSAATTGAPPSNLHFNYPTTSTMRLYWDAASNGNVEVAGYRIDLATDGGFTMVVPGYANKDVGNVAYVILDGLQPGATYYARVRAYDASGSVSGNTLIATMATLNADYAAQSAPVAVTLSNPTLSSLSLSWVPSTSTASITASNYQVQVSTFATFSDFANQPWSGLFYQSSATNAVLTGLGPGTLYYVRVRATDTYGNSSNYVAVSAVTSP